MIARSRAPAVSFAIFFAMAAIAYAATLQFVYPRYFAPFSAFHSDMYIPVDLATRGVSFGELLQLPRPIYWMTLLAGGQFGFKGSLVFFTVLFFATLALAMLVTERFAVRVPVPWWIALAAFVLAFAGPAMYFEPGLDIGYTLAMLFGMLGIYAWESRVPAKPWGAFALAAVCFLLSVLSKESFLPALVVYAIAAGLRDRRTPLVAVAIALLPIAVAAGGITETAHARFVDPTATSTYPYYMSFAPASMWALLTYYTAPLRNAFVPIALIACFAGIGLHRRLLAGVTIFIAAIAMYLPYLILPNHRIYFYECVPMPLLAMLVPLALASEPGLPENRLSRFRTIRIVTIVCLCIAIAFLGLQNRHDPEQYFGLTQQDINRTAYNAVIKNAPRIAPAREVLVRGLNYPYHPWIYPAFLSPLLHFNGDWTVQHEPPFPPIAVQPHARPIEANEVRLRDYDLVLTFDGTGELVKAYHPQAAFSKERAASSPSFEYPVGLVVPSDETAAVLHGVYPAHRDETCCFLGKSATIVLAKSPGDSTAIFTFFVPDFAPFSNAPERIAMTFDGIAVAPIEVSKGMQEVAVRLPRAVAAKTRVNAFLDMTISYVPAKIGLNQDPRTLSIVLSQVRYR